MCAFSVVYSVDTGRYCVLLLRCAFAVAADAVNVSANTVAVGTCWCCVSVYADAARVVYMCCCCMC